MRLGTSCPHGSVRAMLGLIDLLIPRRCIGCNVELKEGALCARCSDTLPVRSAPLCPHCDIRVPGGTLSIRCRRVLKVSRIAIPSPYEHPMVKASIDELKYKGMKDLAEPLGKLLSDGIGSQLGGMPLNAVLVPVPLHPERERKRGFNQARLLAHVAGGLLDVPVSEIMVRTRNTPKQVKLSAHARKENLTNAFSARINDSKKTYIIIDDVMTTGSTIRTCAQALRKAGAKTIWAASVAQSTT